MEENPRLSLKIRVQMDGNTPRYELWYGDTFLQVITFAEIVEAAQQFVGALRWEPH